jgi:tRNA modification GTPase
VTVDTVAALATSPGPGALAIVRWSGPEALGILARLLPDGMPLPETRRATLVTLRHPDGGAGVDQGVVVVYRAPASFTGEDLVEFTGHGGRTAPALVLDAVVAAGARLAEAGDFTRRAYLHGKLDLVQAEAVADVVEGRSRAQHRTALRQLERGLSRRIAELREQILELEVLLAHHLDFPDEDEPPVPVERIVERAEATRGGLARLAATAPAGERLRSGALVVLAGHPNAGKSSLYNALLGEERALVTEVPGTTRDALEAEIELGGFPVRLVDTAGLREAGEEVERLGIEVARRFVDAADLILFCVPAGRGLDETEEAFLKLTDPRRERTVVVRTQADRRGGRGGTAGGAEGEVVVSAHSGQGLDDLARAVASRVWGGVLDLDAEAPVLTRARQARAVGRARDEVGAFCDALRNRIPAEVAAVHLREAEAALESVVGVVEGDEVLDRLFRSFCIGK